MPDAAIYAVSQRSGKRTAGGQWRLPALWFVGNSTRETDEDEILESIGFGGCPVLSEDPIFLKRCRFSMGIPRMAAGQLIKLVCFVICG